MTELAYVARSINLVFSISLSPVVGGFDSVPSVAQPVGPGNGNDEFLAALDIRV